MTIDSKYIDNLIVNYVKVSPKMSEIVHYCIDDGGKRLRPLLFLKTVEQLGTIDNDAERIALALECIHSYSLVHDDLPCMDNDTYRRGKLSCHAKFGYANAVLSGDALLNYAMEIALTGNLANANYCKALNYLFICSGSNGMIGGQFAELNCNNVTENQVYDIALCKTAMLFQASLGCAGLLCGCDLDTCLTLCTIGQFLGVAFQFCDDLNDEGTDEISIVSAVGREKAKRLCVDNATKAKELCGKLQFDCSYVVELLDDILNKANE